MPQFVEGQTVETTEPFVQVEASPQNPLRPGRMVFQLTVVDDSGNESAPASFTVFVVDSERPTAILTGPEKVPQGQNFRLDGSRSTDIGGRVVRYRWTLTARG